MATIARINANRHNTIASTGPQSAQGKSSSSRNATDPASAATSSATGRHGLFSVNGFVCSNDRDAYNQVSAALLENLQPVGAFEELFANEIVNAAWRLRRCSNVEAGLVDPTGESQSDPMQNEANSRLQASIDRARAQASGLLRRATAELRTLQTERLLREKLLPKCADPSALGLAGYKDVVRTALSMKVPATPTAKTERSQSEPAPQPVLRAQIPVIGRNSHCPCGSGVKYKRCCGINAPAVLNIAAS